MELHPNGTNLEINAGRELLNSISKMSDSDRAGLPVAVRQAYDALWGMWLERRERDQPKITDRNRYYT